MNDKLLYHYDPGTANFLNNSPFRFPRTLTRVYAPSIRPMGNWVMATAAANTVTGRAHWVRSRKPMLAAAASAVRRAARGGF